MKKIKEILNNNKKYIYIVFGILIKAFERNNNVQAHNS